MGFTVYKSSAGSGKTFTLVKEYLKLVLADPVIFRHILAITFTNKAANEMKQRILDALFGIGNQGAEPLSGTVRIMLDQIVKETGLTEVAIRKNAEIVSTLILHNYNDFAISTIDSFVHRVIRSFSFDLHLPMNFEVELDTEDVLRKAIDVLISRVGYDQKLTDLLVSFVQSKTDDEKSWKIEEDLYAVAKQLLDEESQVHIQKLQSLTLEQFSEINRKIIAFLSEVERSWQETAEKAMAMMEHSGIPPEAFYRGKNGIGIYFYRLSKRRFDMIKPNSYVAETIAEDKWYAGKTDAAARSKIDEVKPQLTEAYNLLSKSIENHYKRYVLLGEIRKNIYPLAILNEIEKIVQEYKSANGILLISEFNRKIASIALNEPVPFIYERLGGKYRHFMVDEFQDTSILQWQNLLPLFENSLGEGHFNMVVGDAKQAIYRWRSGEVEQFVALPSVYKNPDKPFAREREQALKRNYIEQFLKYNYRSRISVVEFNNDFFETVSLSLGSNYQDIYKDARQVANPSKKGGYVEINFFDEDNEDGAIDFREFNRSKVLEVIEEVRTKGYAWEDIAILCRNNNNAAFIAGELLKSGIKVISSESLLLSNSAQVRLIVAVASFTLNPDDTIAQVEIVNWLVNRGMCNPDRGEALSDFGLFGAGAMSGESPDQRFVLSLKKSGIDFQRKDLIALTTYEFCEEVARLFHLSDDPDGYMTFFLDAVLKQEKNQPFGLKEFIKWWQMEQGKLSVVLPEKLNAVKVMTIHKSKGLEFPVVIYPFASERVRNTKEKLWVDLADPLLPGLNSALVNTTAKLQETDFALQYEEESGKSLLDLMNLLYVVMTRAEDRLYIVAPGPPKNDSGTHSTPKILKQYLVEKQQWKDGLNLYSFGDMETFNEKIRTERSRLSLSHYHSSDWRDRISLKLHYAGYWGEPDTQPKRHWGTLVHSVLSEIDTPQDIDPVLNRFHVDGIISNEEVSELSATIKRLVQKPEVAGFFEPGLVLRKESDILLPGGQTFRPDRLIIEADKAVVIDFKTGLKQTSHADQLNAYMDILNRMGYPKVEGYLLYIYEDEVLLKI
jgi:ATP-dependent exoDNAse (exonuclease V) beta subunit